MPIPTRQYREGQKMLNRCTALVTALTCWPIAAMAQTQPASYSASWASVDQHPPAPEWFQDAKFGIYFHWGAFGTAEFGSEWYPRNMFNKAGNSAEYQHQLQVYGDPLGNWGYDKFINGANDKSGHFVQFAPKLVTSGGNWDPDAMAQLIVDAGAWFAGPVAEHHDGYSMWDSKVERLELGRRRARCSTWRRSTPKPSARRDSSS